MPAFVRTNDCDGCRSREEALCEYICPHDLMALDRDGSVTGHPLKAYNREPEQCWECYACVKLCPRYAIEVRHYADVVPLGASVQPIHEGQAIEWAIRFRNGTVKQFRFATRTTPPGSADPYGGEPDADLARLDDGSVLFTRGTHACDMSQFIAD